MSYKKILLSILVVVLLWSPVALLLRTQQPWNCFPRTYDESYFLQAVKNWSDGKGFMNHSQTKPFDPALTVGVPLAWGGTLVHKLTRTDWTQSLRLWVYSNFIILLGLLFVAALRWGKTVFSPLIAVLVYVLAIEKAPDAKYLTYGILGDLPGALVAAAALLCLNRRRWLLAGALAAAAFFVKPTFLFLIPATVLAAFILERKRAWQTLLAASLVFACGFALIAWARHETILEYWTYYQQIARAVSLPNAGQSLWDYYRVAGFFTVSLSLFMLLGGGFFAYRQWRTSKSYLTGAEWAALIFLLIAHVYFLLLHAKPVPKQWFAFYGLAAWFLALRLGSLLGSKIQSWLRMNNESESVLRAVVLTAVIVWAFNVPSFYRREYLRASPHECPSKQQEAIGDELLAQKEAGALNKDNYVALAPDVWLYFVHQLGWNPSQYHSWKEIPEATNSKLLWVSGANQALFPAPEGCETKWKGADFAILRCSHIH